MKSIVKDPESMERERFDTCETLCLAWREKGIPENQLSPDNPVDIREIETFVNKYDSFFREFEQLRKEHTNGVMYAVRLAEADLEFADIQGHCISVPSISKEQIVEFRVINLEEGFDFNSSNQLRISNKEKLAALRRVSLRKNILTKHDGNSV